MLLLPALPVKTRAASDADIDRLTSYAVILGRATACGENTHDPAARVGAWIDRTFTGSEHSSMLRVLISGMRYHAEQQASGQSPDSCSSIRNTMRAMTWPDVDNKVLASPFKDENAGGIAGVIRDAGYPCYEALSVKMERGYHYVVECVDASGRKDRYAVDTRRRVVEKYAKQKY